MEWLGLKHIGFPSIETPSASVKSTLPCIRSFLSSRCLCGAFRGVLGLESLWQRPDTRHYDVTALSDEEGMGQVCQATDTKLEPSIDTRRWGVGQ